MIRGYVGRPGGGKTSTMVDEAFKRKQRGRRVISNIPLVDNRLRKRQEYWFFGKTSIGPANERTYGKPWTDRLIVSIGEMLEEDNTDVLLDEVHMWLPSTAWKDISFEVRQYLAQQRKDGIDIYWTAQSAGRVFNVIRDLTAIVWACTRYGALTQLIGTDPETKEAMGKRWLWQSPAVWDLYNTRFKVGDGQGVAGTEGSNERYLLQAARRAAAAGVVADETSSGKRRLPAYATLQRVELPDGSVKYVRSAELVKWWRERDSGLDVGPSPIAEQLAKPAPAGDGPHQVERIYDERTILAILDAMALKDPLHLGTLNHPEWGPPLVAPPRLHQNGARGRTQ